MVKPMTVQFVFGRPLSAEELELIGEEIESMSPQPRGAEARPLAHSSKCLAQIIKTGTKVGNRWRSPQLDRRSDP